MPNEIVCIPLPNVIVCLIYFLSRYNDFGDLCTFQDLGIDIVLRKRWNYELHINLACPDWRSNCNAVNVGYLVWTTPETGARHGES